MDLFNAKVDFILLLGRSLHGCGAAAHHLERALTKAALKLGVHAEFLAFPTGIIASFYQGEEQRSVVIRTEPGQIDLSKLSRIDEAADLVIAGKKSLMEGTHTIESIHFAEIDIPKWLLV